jgi:hypothetical protein
MKTIRHGAKGHRFPFARHEISHLSQWPQKHFTHHASPSSPHHVNNEKNGSPQDPNDGYKCSVIPQRLKDGKDPTSCTMRWKKKFEGKQNKIK